MERENLILKILVLAAGIVFDIILIIIYTDGFMFDPTGVIQIFSWLLGPSCTLIGILWFLPNSRSRGIFLVILGIVILLSGVIYYAIPGPYTYIDSYKYITITDQIRKIINLLGCLGGGVPLFIVGLVIWARSRRYEPSRTKMKAVEKPEKEEEKRLTAVKSEKEEKDELELEGIVQ